jgi:4-hydroxythreonine-4-phosphate dehydrogenase
MSDKNQDERLSIKVGITAGDINGIGPEIILRSLADPLFLAEITPVVYASGKVVSFFKKPLNINELMWNNVSRPEDIKPRKFNLVNITNDDVTITMGQPSEATGKFAYRALEVATQDLASGKIDVLVTAPINKQSIQSAGFKFPGHTEYLAHLSNVDRALMLMISENLKVAVVTGHIPLTQVSAQITREKITDCLAILNQSLQKDFMIVKPRIAVLGLNPHAGDNGLLGDEEKNIIQPAIDKAKHEGILAFGAYAADGFFGSGAFKQFDAVLAMYHDQGLVPFKALSFGRGVNFTAGLPIVRTSPDHGVAYDMAGKGMASLSSFMEAVFTAREVYINRRRYKEMNVSPLQPQKVNED